ncbi:MAG: hypothetical protein H6974_09465 [Gammaproteobacteria bacterium]|nr:hypothetical protein [Gammaproteobacteria bacterium]
MPRRSLSPPEDLSINLVAGMVADTVAGMATHLVAGMATHLVADTVAGMATHLVAGMVVGLATHLVADTVADRGDHHFHLVEDLASLGHPLVAITVVGDMRHPPITADIGILTAIILRIGVGLGFGHRCHCFITGHRHLMTMLIMMTMTTTGLLMTGTSPMTMTGFPMMGTNPTTRMKPTMETSLVIVARASRSRHCLMTINLNPVHHRCMTKGVLDMGFGVRPSATEFEH